MMRLDTRTTLRSCIVGASNRAAVASLRTAISAPAEGPNPLLLRGATGVGKSTLLHAAGTEIVRRGRTPIALTAEEFRNAYVDAIWVGTIAAFRRAIDACDALIIDELEDLATTPATADELARALRAYVERNKPVLLASAPMQTLVGESLVWRFATGDIVDIAAPTLRERTIALQRLARRRRRPCSRAALTRIARCGHTIPDVRIELERALLAGVG